MANLKGRRPFNDVRVYIGGSGIKEVQVEGKDPFYSVPLYVANDQVSNDNEVITDTALISRQYKDKEGNLKTTADMPYSRKQMVKMAEAMGLDPNAPDFNPKDMNYKGFSADVFVKDDVNKAGLRTVGLLVNTSKELKPLDVPFDYEAHKSTTARVLEERKAAREAEKATQAEADVANEQSLAQTEPDVEMGL